MATTVEITALRALDDLYPVVELQKVHWGNDLEAVIPAHMLFSLANHGGHVLAAKDGERLVGVLIGFLGTNLDETQSKRPAMANLQIVSKRMVVHPDYRGQGIGYRLKLAQRDRAITQGVRLVTWTFDPMLALNAHLNIRKLGIISKTYHQNYYGTDESSGLAPGGVSDRLLAEWWVTHRRVEEKINGSRSDLTLMQYLETAAPIVNPARMIADGVRPFNGEMQMPTGSFALVEVPLDFLAIVERDPELGKLWRQSTRTAFQRLLAENFVVTDFLREKYEGRERAFYLLSYDVGFDLSRS